MEDLLNIFGILFFPLLIGYIFCIKRIKDLENYLEQADELILSLKENNEHENN